MTFSSFKNCLINSQKNSQFWKNAILKNHLLHFSARKTRKNFFCLTCHGSSANLALWPPMILFANCRCLVIPHSGSLCRISLATRFWARPVPTKVSCNKENQISFFVAHRLSSSKQSRVFSRSDVIWIFRLMDTPLLLYTWQRNSLSGS